MLEAKKVLIPYPKQIADSTKDVKIGTSSKAAFKFEAAGSGDVFDEARMVVLQAFRDKAAITEPCEKAEYKIALKVDPENPSVPQKSEGYSIIIDQNGANLIAFDSAGAYYAAQTFSALIHIENDCVLIPEIEIADYPDFKVRGQFLECRYGSDFMLLDDWKKAIDYFASLKQNSLTIGIYGCWGIQYDRRISEYLYIPFEKYPNLETPRDIKYYSVKNRKWIVEKNLLPVMFEEDFFGELINYGNKKNIKIKPLFNSLGHNSLLPRLFPEVSAKYHDGSDKCFGFCTNEDATYNLMFDLYDEIIDRYLTPNGIDSIEIGLDEVNAKIGMDSSDIYKKISPYCECEKCKEHRFVDLMTEYIIRISKHLIEKGMKSIYIYHDMFFDKENFINEKLKQKFVDAGVYDYIVFDWWSYSGIKEKMFMRRSDEVNNIFRSIMKPMTGYFHWAIPTENNHNINILTEKARELNFEGIEAYGAYEECFDKNFKYCADISWNTDTVDRMNEFDERYLLNTFSYCTPKLLEGFSAMSEIMSNNYIQKNILFFDVEYYCHSYLLADLPYPRDYPADLFEQIFAAEEVFLPYLLSVREKSQFALDAFGELPYTHYSDIWRLIAFNYNALSDVFYTLSVLYKEKAPANELVCETDRILKKWESLMKLTEDVRIRANSFQYMRDMSIIRQFICDFRAYLDTEINSGRVPVFEIKNLRNIRSDIYDYIR